MKLVGEFLLANLESITILVGISATFIYIIVENITHRKTKTELLNSFSKTVEQLASANAESQLSAAIILRRFLNVKLGFRGKFLFNETVNVISSILRTLPTGIYQKTLGDGLAYAVDLSEKDLQKTNLQDLYIGNKQHRIKMRKTDLFMADLSYALLQNIDGQEAIFYNAILLRTQIKDCDFSFANFMGADLTNALFTNVVLYGANFSNAFNVPEEIDKCLVNGIYQDTKPVTLVVNKNPKTIFFSMPSVMTKSEELLTKEYKRILEMRKCNVIYYIKDNYPKYGQFNRVRESIRKSSGVIAFGFKQINIAEGYYRPNTSSEKKLSSCWMSTPWSDIEVGMSLMLGLPVLMVHDGEVKQGVFDDNLNECFIGKICVDTDIRDIEHHPVFDNWINKVEKVESDE